MSVITVGDGRGFVIAPKHNRFGKRFVLSAAHCLPWLPPAHPATYTEELTYGPLLGPLGKEPSVLAECAFVDPVADLAVLRSPDNQELSEEADAYEALLEPMAPLEVADVGGREVLGQLLSLKGSWFSCTLQHRGGPFWIKDAKQPIQSGMSGSPILAANGASYRFQAVATITAPIRGSSITCQGGSWPSSALTQAASVRIRQKRVPNSARNCCR